MDKNDWKDIAHQSAVDARKKLKQGMITADYPPDRNDVIEALQVALMDEIVASVQYMMFHYMSTGLQGRQMKGFFKETAIAEMKHAEEVSERIRMLGGVPRSAMRDIEPGSLWEVKTDWKLKSMLEAVLIAERTAIGFYRRVIKEFGDDDPVTTDMITSILADEEDHAESCADALYELDPGTGKRY